MSNTRTPRRYAAWWLFPSSRVSRAAVLAAAVAGLVTVALAPATYRQPFSEWQATAAAAPLAPGGLALALGFGTTNAMASLERGTGSRVRAARLAWAASWACGAVMVTALAAWSVEAHWHVPMLRNVLGLSGLALLGAVVLGARQAWMPVFLLIAATLVVGRDPYTATPHDWALLLAPAGSVAGLIVVVGVFAAGAGAYAWWDSRPSRGVWGEG